MIYSDRQRRAYTDGFAQPVGKVVPEVIRLQSLRAVLCSGEPLSSVVVDAFLQASGCELVNHLATRGCWRASGEFVSLMMLIAACQLAIPQITPQSTF